MPITVAEAEKRIVADCPEDLRRFAVRDLERARVLLGILRRRYGAAPLRVLLWCYVREAREGDE